MGNDTVLAVCVTDDTSRLEAAVRALRPRKVHILASTEHREKAIAVHHVFSEQLVSRTWIMHGPVWEDTFALLSKLANEEHGLVIVTNTASSEMESAAVAASYAHGVPAMRITNSGIEELPAMPGALYERLGPRKIAILNALTEKPTRTIREVAAALNISAPLVSHHVHGTRTRPGLITLRLVMQHVRGALTLTETGRIIARGAPEPSHQEALI